MHKVTFRKDKIKKLGEKEVGHDIKPKDSRGPALSSIKVKSSTHLTWKGVVLAVSCKL